MNVIIGKTSGFCNGVSYTVKTAEEAIKNEKIYCLGEIVHYERVINDLEKNGMITIKNIDEAPNNSKVIIRAHGELKETYDKALQKNIEIINGSSMNKIYIVSQTTFNADKYDKLVDYLKSLTEKDIIIDKTIWDATSKRQNETKELSKKVNTMIIVGGRKSSNTKELELIAKEYCNNVLLVQNKDDIQTENIIGENIGIMAGASTPNVVVDEIVDKLNRQDF